MESPLVIIEIVKCEKGMEDARRAVCLAKAINRLLAEQAMEWN